MFKCVKGRVGHMKKHYDVIIIGAGPAGIFTALELTKKMIN